MMSNEGDFNWMNWTVIFIVRLLSCSFLHRKFTEAQVSGEQSTQQTVSLLQEVVT